jgi:hypothetical protein
LIFTRVVASARFLVAVAVLGFVACKDDRTVGPTVPTFLGPGKALGIEWEEEIAAGSVQLRARKALMDSTCQLVALTDAHVHMDRMALKLGAAKLNTRTNRLVGKGFELRHGTLQIKGHQVELDLRSKTLQADNIMAFLYIGGHRSNSRSEQAAGIAASDAQGPKPP